MGYFEWLCPFRRIHLHFITCDKCLESSTRLGFESQKEAIEHAKMCGWEAGGSNVLCPDCIKKE